MVCTSFIYGLKQLLKRNGLDRIDWNFGVPNHGKDIYDRIGVIVNYEYSNAVWNGLLIWDIHQPYERQIKQYMIDNFTGDKDIEFKFYSIPAGIVYKRKANCNTFRKVQLNAN